MEIGTQEAKKDTCHLRNHPDRVCRIGIWVLPCCQCKRPGCRPSGCCWSPRTICSKRRIDWGCNVRDCRRKADWKCRRSIPAPTFLALWWWSTRLWSIRIDSRCRNSGRRRVGGDRVLRVWRRRRGQSGFFEDGGFRSGFDLVQRQRSYLILLLKAYDFWQLNFQIYWILYLKL